MTLPDPTKSRAVLIGTHTVHNELDIGLNDLPAVERNLSKLNQFLTDGTVWTLPQEHCMVLSQPDDEWSVLRMVRQAATEATDTLLVYYAGHGLLDGPERQLHLALAGAQRVGEFLPYTKLSALLRPPDRKGPRTVVILDCCYSGRALDDRMGIANDFQLRAEIDGVCVLTASAETRRAISPPNEELTAFTGELIRVLDDGIPSEPAYLDMASIYRETRRRIAIRQDIPAPQMGTRAHGADIVLAPNRARLHSTPIGESNAVAGSIEIQRLSTYLTFIQAIDTWRSAILALEGANYAEARDSDSTDDEDRKHPLHAYDKTATATQEALADFTIVHTERSSKLAEHAFASARHLAAVVNDGIPSGYCYWRNEITSNEIAVLDNEMQTLAENVATAMSIPPVLLRYLEEQLCTGGRLTGPG